MEYALATSMTDTGMTGDNYRIWLMDNPKLQVLAVTQMVTRR